MISSGPLQFQDPMMGGISPGGFGGGGDPMQQMLMGIVQKRNTKGERGAGVLAGNKARRWGECVCWHVVLEAAFLVCKE